MHDAKVQNQQFPTESQAERERWVDEELEEYYTEVEEALERFRADQREGLEVLGCADAGTLIRMRFQREADRLRREADRLKTERAKNLAARAVDAQYRPNVTGRTNEAKPVDWQVLATSAYPDRDDDAILARFDVQPVDTDRWLRMDTVRDRFRDLAAFLLEFTPDGRYRDLALTKLEEAMFFANRGIATEGR